MRTRSSNVMILKQPLNKWDKKNRATEVDPAISFGKKVDCEGRNYEEFILMTTKLRTILRDYGERVAISNSLVLEILDEYIKKSRKLKKAEKKIAQLEAELKELRQQ